MAESIDICGFCKNPSGENLYPIDDIFGNKFTLKQCYNCKALYLSPRPTPEMLAQAYDSFYYGEKEEKFSSPAIEKVLDFFRTGRARKLSKYLKSGNRILDVGCGNGRFLKYMQNFGKFELYGTELDGNSAKRASTIKEINLKVGMLERSDFQPEFFNAISMFHVFEHLTEPSEMLDIIQYILKKDGYFMISFPNIESYQSQKFKGKWLHLDPPRHLIYFKPRDFTVLMEKKGFELVHQKFLSLEQNPYGMIQSILNVWCKKREVLFERLKGNKKYAPEYGNFNIFLQKLFFIGTFPFFAFTDIIMSSLNKGATVEFLYKKK